MCVAMLSPMEVSEWCMSCSVACCHCNVKEPQCQSFHVMTSSECMYDSQAQHDVCSCSWEAIFWRCSWPNARLAPEISTISCLSLGTRLIQNSCPPKKPARTCCWPITATIHLEPQLYHLFHVLGLHMCVKHGCISPPLGLAGHTS